MRDIPFPKEGFEEGTVPGFSISVLTGSQATGTITKNELKELTIDLNFHVLQIGGPVAEGIVGGVWNLETGLFNGTGDQRSLPNIRWNGRPNGRKTGVVARVHCAGIGTQCGRQDNQLDEAQINAACFSTTKPRSQPHNSKGYKLGSPEGYNGNANMTVVSLFEWSEDEGSNTTCWLAPKGRPDDPRQYHRGPRLFPARY